MALIVRALPYAVPLFILRADLEAAFAIQDPVARSDAVRLAPSFRRS